MKRAEWGLVALVVAHLAVVVLHAVSHSALLIVPGPADSAFIVSVILIAPVAALPLFRIHGLLASGLLVVAMLSAFAYGLQGHFLVPGPDNVSVVATDPWTLAFIVTAGIIGALEIATVLVAALLFWRTIRTPSESREPPG